MHTWEKPYRCESCGNDFWLKQDLKGHIQERSGSAVEFLTGDREDVGSSLRGVTRLCPWAKHINSCLVLVLSTKEDVSWNNWKIVDWDVKIIMHIPKSNTLPTEPLRSSMCDGFWEGELLRCVDMFLFLCRFNKENSQHLSLRRWPQ